MICILKAFIAWLIMVLVGTNLIGLIVRGFVWSPPSIKGTTDRVQDVLHRESSRMSLVNLVMTVGSILITAAYFFALFHFWNIGLALAGGTIMVSRLPDLLWEIRAGRKVTRNDHPKGFVYFFTSILLWASLVLIWYSFCFCKS